MTAARRRRYRPRVRTAWRVAGLVALLLAPAARPVNGQCRQCSNDAHCRTIFNPCVIDFCRSIPIIGGCCDQRPVTCDRGPCFTSVCDPRTVGCIYTPVCRDDGNVCNGKEECVADPGGARCVQIDTPNCNDGDACTVDSCNAQYGCQHVALDCNDGDACTFDSCRRSSGCMHEPVFGCCRSNADCPDEACRFGRLCTGAFCTGGTPRDCDDGDTATIDTCDPAIGCVHTSTTPTTTIPTGGSCRADTDCDPDADPCLVSACVAGTGCVSHPRDGLDAVLCVCSRRLPASCTDPLPRRIARPSTHACTVAARAATAKAKKQARLVGRMARLLARARKAALRSTDALPTGCADALGALFADGSSRAEAFRSRGQ